MKALCAGAPALVGLGHATPHCPDRPRLPLIALSFPPSTPGITDGCVALSVANLDAEVKFCVALQLPASYPLGVLGHTCKIWFGSE